METWNIERLEQNVLAATDETMGFMVGLVTFGAATVEAGRHSVGATLDIMPVMEEDDGPEPVNPRRLVWPMPAYPKNLGSIALGVDGMVHAADSQFSLAA